MGKKGYMEWDRAILDRGKTVELSEYKNMGGGGETAWGGRGGGFSWET
jgi:hypothetical protein